MRKIYYKICVLLLIVATLPGCKLDPPIYPSVTSTADLTDNGSTITYTINGTTTTLKLVAFQVIAASSEIPNGSTQIIGAATQGTSSFTLFFSGTTAGTYDIDILYLDTAWFGENGKVTATTLNVTSSDGLHGTIKGTFTTDIANILTNETITGVTGTFNITVPL